MTLSLEIPRTSGFGGSRVEPHAGAADSTIARNADANKAADFPFEITASPSKRERQRDALHGMLGEGM
jgi:hypothetical protein